jgi:farnesyl diphosphate synthase
MGLERAKQQAEMLVQQANDHLATYGAEADLLRAIANYITERDR